MRHRLSYPPATLNGMRDVPSIKLSAGVRAVLAVLADHAGVKLSIRDLARECGRSPSVVRKAVTELEKGALARHMVQAHEPDRPPHPVYWATQAGRDVAHAHSSR